MMRGTEHHDPLVEDETRTEIEEEEDGEIVEECPPPYPDSQCSRTFPLNPKYSARRSYRRERAGSGKLGSISLRSPISILATPPPASSSSSSLLSGPHSAPATFSWGKQSPIPRPPPHHPSSAYHSPLTLSSSPFLLSPGQPDHPSPFTASSPRLTSSPLLLSSPLEAAQPVAAVRYLDDPATASAASPTLSLVGGSAAAALMMNMGRPDIPVGIAVARQRQTDQAAAAAAASVLKEPAAAHTASPLPWGASYPLFTQHPGGGLTPLLHSLPLTDYHHHPHHSLARGDPVSLHGGYLTGGSAGYWSPYGYPLLLPPSLSHYQHYHNQLLLLQQAAILSPPHAPSSQVPLYGPPPGHLSQDPSAAFVLGPYDPYRPAVGPHPSAFTSIQTKSRESKTKDDSGLETSENMSQEEATDLSRSEVGLVGKKELILTLEEDNISVGTDLEPAGLLLSRQNEESVIEIPGGDAAPSPRPVTPPIAADAGDSDAGLAAAEPTEDSQALTEEQEQDDELSASAALPKPLLNGLELLTEGIARLEKYEQSHWTEKRASGSRLTRHASVDSSMSPLKGLGLLCDVATQKIHEEMQLLQPGTSRTARSKSMDMERHGANSGSDRKRPDLNRNYHVATSRDDIREFIRRRASRSSEGSSASSHLLLPGSPCKAAGSSPCRSSPGKVAALGGSPCKDPEDMDAWELSMRLDMADIQRKYRQKYQELFRLESRKDKRKVNKRRKSRRKSLDSSTASGNKTPKIIYTINKAGAHKSQHSHARAHNSHHYGRGAIPSIRVECPSAAVKMEAERQSSPVSINNRQRPPSYGVHDEDSDEPRSAAGGDTDDSDSVKGGAGSESPRAANNSFQETFAKFRQSYLSSTSATAPKKTVETVAVGRGVGSQLKLKSDQRPSPFENLMKLSGKSTIKSEPSCEHPEVAKIKQEPEMECDDRVRSPLIGPSPSPYKRKSPEANSSGGGGESPGKKKPKMEKFIVASAHVAADMWHQSCTANKSPKKHKKERLYKDHHDRHRDGDEADEDEEEDEARIKRKDERAKKSKKKAREENAICKEEKEDEEDNDTKRKERRKKKRKEKRKQRVRVTGLEEDRVMEIMDRTPTPLGRTSTPLLLSSVKQEIKSFHSESEDELEVTPSCVLTERNLRDSQRILFRIGSHFHPGRITEISPPDIYGILVDRERGNKPHIFSREEVLSQAILEVEPPSQACLLAGMRVCAYWSTKYHYLHPGTIVKNTQGLNLPPGYVIIELDDGDSRDFHVESIRILPPDYPIVVSEPDPMAVLSALKRRRTLSAESRHLTAIKQEPEDHAEDFQEQINVHPPPAKITSTETKPYRPKKKYHHRRRRKSGESSSFATNGDVSCGTAAAKEWCSEVTPDLKIRIRSPDTRLVTAAAAAPATMPPACEASSLLAPPKISSSTTAAATAAQKMPGDHDSVSSPGVNPAALLPPTPGGRHDWNGGGGKDEDEEDSAFESNGKFEEDDDLEEDEEEEEEAAADVMASIRKRFPSEDKSKIRAFLPPQHLLWVWGDPGTKPRNKTRKIFHQEIVRGKARDERLSVGDSAVFLSTSRPDRPYIGRIESMWESWSGNMKVRVRWFYHAEETEGTGEGGRRIQDLSEPGALFESCHFDENDIQTISHKCDVLDFAAFQHRLLKEPGLKSSIYDNNDLYYLAGSYDPVVGTLSFKPGVIP